MNYGRLVTDLVQAIYAAHEAHPEFELRDYNGVLERSGLKWDGQVMETADVSNLDGQAVMALLLGACRTDQFCEGALLGFIEDGCMKRWIERLQEIDGRDNANS